MQLQQIDHWLKRIDFFGKNITLNMNGDHVYRTFIGGIVTLGTAAVLIIVFLSSPLPPITLTLFIAVSIVESITAKTSHIFHDDPPIMELTRSSFMFAVNIEQDDFVTNPYFDISIIYRIDYTMYLRGVYSSDIFSYYRITILDCVDDVANNKICKTASEIAATQSSQNGYFRFQLYQSNNIINADQAVPKASYLSDVSQFLFSPNQLYINSNMYYSSYTMNVDTNIFIGTTIETEIVPYFSQSETMTQVVPGISGEYARFYLRKSLFSDTIKRSYQKAVIFVITFFIGFLTERQFNIDLANKLYEFEADPGEKIVSNHNRDHLLKQKNNDNNHIKQGPLNDQQSNPSSSQDKDSRDLASPARIEGSELRNLIKERARAKKKHKTAALSSSDARITEFKKFSTSVETSKQMHALDNKLRIAAMIKKTPSQSVELANISEVDSIREIGNQPSDIQKQKQQQQISDFRMGGDGIVTVIDLRRDEDTDAHQQPQIKRDLTQKIDSDSKMEHTTVLQEYQPSSINTGISLNKQQSEDLQLKQKNSMETKATISSKIDLEGIAGVEFKSRKSFLVNQFKCLVEKQRKISLRVGYFLNKIFCGRYFNSHENSLIDRASREISKDLDVFNLIERIKEVEKMKQILFDKEQQILFNFCPKPVLNLRENNTVLLLSYLKRWIYRFIYQQQNLTRAQILERLSSMQMKRDTKAAQKRETQLLKQSTLRQSKVLGTGKLLKNTMMAVSMFKKGIKKQESLELDSYKYLYEAYDSIMASDPKLKKRKNLSLINQLGREMKDIFETSNLIRFNDKGRASVVTPRSSQLHFPLNSKRVSKTVVNRTSMDVPPFEPNASLPPFLEKFKGGVKRIQTFSEVDLKEVYNEVLKQSSIEVIHEEDDIKIDSEGNEDDVIPEEKATNVHAGQLIHLSFDDDDNIIIPAESNSNRNYHTDPNYPPNTHKDLLPKNLVKESLVNTGTPRGQQQQIILPTNTEHSFGNQSNIREFNEPRLSGQGGMIDFRNIDLQLPGSGGERHNRVVNSLYSSQVIEQSAPQSAKNQSSQHVLISEYNEAGTTHQLNHTNNPTNHGNSKN